MPSKANLVKLPARYLVVAPRLPDQPKRRGVNPFDADGDAVVDCDVPGCTWHAIGERPLVKKAWQDHYRQAHGSAQEVGVLLINHPRHQ